jgi:ABC-2 type transport system ATP-binding protein
MPDAVSTERANQTEDTQREELILSLHGVAKQFGNFSVLRGLDLSLARGAIHGLVGLNGSGKTTTLDCILGLQRIDAGEIQVLGFPPAELCRAAGAIVAVFDSPSLQPNLSVRQALSHARILCPTPARSVEEVMSLLGLSRYAGFKLRSLSLGNRRRASIAHALLGNPQLILLDEPFNGLDAGGVDEVLALISRLNRELGMSFLLSSHQLPYLQSICTHLSILHGGRIAASGSLETLLAGSHTTLRIETPQAHAALALLTETFTDSLKNGEMNIEASPDTAPTMLRLTLKGTTTQAPPDEATNFSKDYQPLATPAGVNRLLVTAGIEITGLAKERVSVESLFRKITAQPSAELEARV